MLVAMVRLCQIKMERILTKNYSWKAIEKGMEKSESYIEATETFNFSKRKFSFLRLIISIILFITLIMQIKINIKHSSFLI